MKKFLLLLGAMGAFLIGYGASASFAAYPSGGIHGRGEHNGYFTNINDDMGSPVLRRVYDGQAIRPDVVDADSFISFIKYTKLDIDNNGSGDTRDKTGAAFIIHTMIGSGTSSRGRPPTDAQINEWEQRVRYLDYNNKVNWSVNYSYTINSYWQATDGGGSNPNDDAFYDENGTSPAIVFRNMSNAVVYAIRIECANPVGTGSLGPLPNNPDYNMWGGTTVSDATPGPGDTITFRHYLENIGANATTPNTISWRVYRDATQLFSGNAGTFAGTGTAGARKDNIQVENYVIPANTAPGTQICRQIWFSPDTESGGSQYGTERCATVQYSFAITPILNISVNGAASTGTAEAGDTITFNYYVQNSGDTMTQPLNCTIYGIVENGSYTKPTAPAFDNGSRPAGYVSPVHGCPRSFPRLSTTQLTPSENITAVANTTVCRTFILDPKSYTPAPTYGTGNYAWVEDCIRVVSKPYLKVFGGDVLAGSALETAPATCTNNTNAQIMSWNKRDASYTGAGVQYAAMALNRIGDFASAQRAGASAIAPTDLSFASTTSNAASGNFGGTFGSAPCIKDYYADKPAGLPTGSSNISSLGTGQYQITGNTTLSGNINPGQKTVLYVDGNVNITGNITYPGSWTAGNIPFLLLIVRGNIYIAPGVTGLDGNFVAQGNGATGGVIYTCASGFTPPALGGTLYSTCQNKLTVNGSFTANNVEFLRTHGSLRQSTAAEAMGNGNIAEEFIYGPASWMAQPPAIGETTNYDAITSLPPIL